MVLLLLVAACGDDTGGDSKTIATVNGRAITQAQFEAYLEHKHIPAKDEKRRARALQEYLEREALADVIAKEGVLDPTEVAVEVREFEKQLLLSRYFDKVLADKVDEKAISNYYSQHAEDYEEKKVRVAHVLFRLNPRMSEEERKAKLTAAREAHSKLGAGEDFAAVAEAMSEDKVSARKGGEIGWVTEGSIDPRFSAKVFSMKKDELSEPFETSFGYHVVKLLDAPQVVKKPFQAVQGDIRYQLRAEVKQAESERLKAKVKIERKDGAGDKTPAKPDEAKAQSDSKRKASQETAKKD